MIYRVILDYSYEKKEDAENFMALAKKEAEKLHKITKDEFEKRPDLWNSNRFTLIHDYDDEGNNKCGETISNTDFKEV